MDKVSQLLSELLEEIDFDVNVHPQRDRVLIREVPTSKSSTLWVPEEIANKGVVVAVGPGHFSSTGTRIPVDVAPGDVVIFGKHSGSSQEIGGESLRFLKASDILVKITE